MLPTTRLALLLLLALGLTGCATHLAVPGPPTEAAHAATDAFIMPDGMRLPYRAWLPEGEPWAVMLALHGMNDSRDAWEIPAPDFAQAGIAVFSPDQRGFGDTASRNHWAGIPRMVNDAAELVAQLRARYPTLPVIVLGESMGGAVAEILAARPGHAADAYVLAAPAVWGWGQMDPAVAATLIAASALAPGWEPDPGQVGREITASDNIPALMRMGSDPLTLRRPSVAMLRGLVDLMAAAQDASAHLHGRVLIRSGRRDQLIPPPAAAAAWTKLPPDIRRGFYPNGYHLLLRDHDRALVIADILTWLDMPQTWLPSGADTAAAAWQADHAWQARTPELAPAGHADDTGAEPVWPY